MSMDAGGLAQMTYQSPFHNTIGVSGPGFASRGKASHIKRLSVAPPSQISTIDETQQANVSATPRTSRGHMLAGLRTAPKSATVASSESGFGLEHSRYASPPYSNNPGVPQTATGAFFPGASYGSNGGFNQQMYLRPEQILAPPAIQLNNNGGQFDQGLYGELLATNARLAQQQRELQQQLANITAAAQQFDAINLSPSAMNGHQAYGSAPNTQVNSLSEQGYIVSPVPGSPGMYQVLNPFTGAENYVFDSSMQQHQRNSSPPETAWSPSGSRSQTRSPPKSTPSPPQDVERLPSPSATAFRRGHNKTLSSVTGNKGPGQSRTGEHPIRQPRGPPLLQELQEKPTSKYEGSKNFAIRQRRRAVNDLVRAGFARTGL